MLGPRNRSTDSFVALSIGWEVIIYSVLPPTSVFHGRTPAPLSRLKNWSRVSWVMVDQIDMLLWRNSRGARQREFVCFVAARWTGRRIPCPLRQGVAATNHFKILLYIILTRLHLKSERVYLGISFNNLSLKTSYRFVMKNPCLFLVAVSYSVVFVGSHYYFGIYDIQLCRLL
jgi:hypothetical protein